MIYALNVLIIVYLILMAYYWGSIQGLLSAFLHLMLTIVAGALALAVWEPLTVGFLLERMPGTAWCVGLLGPFALMLIVLRVALDKLVPGNMQFHPLVNVIAGGFCGLCSGILIAGLTIIGLGFLPMDVGFMGYQPLKVSDKGQLEPDTGGQLWWEVDRQAAGFFTALSGGSFYSRENLALYRPDLANEPPTMRMTRDFDSSSLATAPPGSVAVTGVHSRDVTGSEIPSGITDHLGTTLPATDHKLVVVDTRWTSKAYDADQTLRVPPTQVRLVTWHDENGHTVARVFAPIGATRLNDKQREFYELGNSRHPYSTSQDPNAELGWVFVIPSGDQPRFLMARDLRLELPPAGTDDEKTMLAALGKYVPPSDLTAKTVSANPGRRGLGPNPVKDNGIEINQPMLPRTVSRNRAMIGLTLQKPEEGTAILNGEGEVEPIKEAGRIDKDVLIDRIYFASQWSPVRIRIDYESHSLLGGVMAWTKSLNALALVDKEGKYYYPTCWVLLDPKTDVQRIHVGGDPIQSATLLPLRTMHQGQELYLYFPVKHGVNIIQYALGDTETKPLDLQIP